VRHRVDERSVAVLVAGPSARKQVRGIGHRLHAAGDDDIELARRDELVCQGDRVKAGQADLVDGDGGHRHRDATFDRGLPSGDLTGAGLQHLAHDHVVDLVTGQPGPGQRGFDGDTAEVDRGEPGERAEELADRRAGAGDNH
jgi:hypothetical protein